MKKYTLYPDLKNIELLKPYKDSIEILVDLEGFSRIGTFKKQDLSSLEGFSLVLEWDLLHNENEIEEKYEQYKNIAHLFQSVRVLDQGLLLLIKDKPIQFIADQGHMNIESLKSLENNYFLEKILLSSQISEDLLQTYSKILQTPLEILFYGKILIFYSPRYLLTEEKIYTQELIDSEESHHKNFLFIQSEFGTSMFAAKTLNLTDYRDRLNSFSFKIDLRDSEESEKLSMYDYLFHQKNFLSLKPCFQGFFIKNKTDKLFTKLKNQHLPENPLGKVLDRKSGSYLLVHFFESFEEKTVFIISPEGKTIEYTITTIEFLGNNLYKLNDCNIPTHSYLYKNIP